MENKIDYKKLEPYRFKKYSVLKEYIDKIKKNLVGERIEDIKRLGVIFNEDILDEPYLELDEPIDIKIGKYHLNIDFACDSDAFCGLNLFDYTETSYQDGLSWKSLNQIYKDNILGRIIKDIVLTKRDMSGYDKEVVKRHEDDFEAIHIVLENGFILKVTNWEDYMTIYELNGNK